MAHLVLILLPVLAGKEKVLVIATHKINWFDSQVFFSIAFITIDPFVEWFVSISCLNNDFKLATFVFAKKNKKGIEVAVVFVTLSQRPEPRKLRGKCLPKPRSSLFIFDDRFEKNGLVQF